MNVAWIGLGQMGLPTAKTISAAGHDVRAYDVRLPTADSVQGLHIAGSPGEAAEGADLICIAVFSDDQVADVLTGPHGMLDRLTPGAIVAVFTTGSVESIRRIAASAPVGVVVLDTCFSRLHCELASGKLTLLIGGDADAVERSRPVFDTFARAVIHVGESGAGRAIKLVNNILYAGHLQLASDAIRLAEASGLDRSLTAAALLQCSGASDVMAWFVENEPAELLETARRYMVKDVAAAIEAGKAAGVEIRALTAATAAYRAD